MKKIIFIFLTAFLTFVSAAGLSAANSSTGASKGEFIKVGAAGAQFLKIGVGARGNAMGTACTSVLNDLTSLNWNPAGIADIHNMQGHFSYTQWFGDYAHNYAAMSLPVSGDFTVGFNVITFGTDKVEVTTLNNPEGTGRTYSINDFALAATFGGKLTQQFTFGVTAKYVTNSFADMFSKGFAFDIGTMYKTGIQGINLGFSILNLGTDMGYTGQDLNTTKKLVEALDAMALDVQYLTSPYPMPLTFRAGISSEIYNEDIHNVLVSADFVTYSDISEQFAIGAEYTWDDMLSLRAGYQIGADQTSFAGGFGINYLLGNTRGVIDYSISPTVDFGLINRISISIGIE